MTKEKFLELVTPPLKNKDYIDLYNDFLEKFKNKYKQYNEDILGRYFKDVKMDLPPNLNDILEAKEMVEDWEHNVLNPLINTGKISVSSIREFFEIIEKILKKADEKAPSPKNIFDLCDTFDALYEKRIKLKVAKAIQKKELSDLTKNLDLDNLKKETLKKVNNVKVTYQKLNAIKNEKEKEGLKQELNQQLKSLPFNTSFKNLEKDFQNFSKSLNLQTESANKIINLANEVLKGNKKFTDFEKEIKNLNNSLLKYLKKKDTLIEKYKNSKDLEEKHKIFIELKQLKESQKNSEYISNVIEKYLEKNKETFTEGNFSNVAKEQLVKQLEIIQKQFGDFLDKDFLEKYKETVKEGNKKFISEYSKTLNEKFTEISKLDKTDKEQLKTSREQFKILNKMYIHTLEKDKKKQIAQNIEKAKNIGFEENNIQNYVEKVAKFEKPIKREEKAFSSTYDMFYQMTTGTLDKITQNVKKSKTLQAISKKTNSVKNESFANVKKLHKKYLLPKKEYLTNKLKMLDVNTAKYLESLFEYKPNKNLSANVEKYNQQLKLLTNQTEISPQNKKPIPVTTLSESVLKEKIQIPKKVISKDPIVSNLTTIAQELGLISYIDKEEYLDSKKEKEESNKISKISKLKNQKIKDTTNPNESSSDNSSGFDYDRNEEESEEGKTKRFKKIKWLKKIKGVGRKVKNFSKNLIETGLIDVAGKALVGGKLTYDLYDEISRDIKRNDLTDDERIADVIGASAQSLSLGLVNKKDVSKILIGTIDKWDDLFQTGSFYSGKAEEKRREYHLKKDWEKIGRKKGVYFVTANDKILTKTKDGKFIFQTPNHFTYLYDPKANTFVIGGRAIPDAVAASKALYLFRHKKIKEGFKSIEGDVSYRRFAKNPIKNNFLRYFITDKSLYENGKLTDKGRKVLANVIKLKKLSKNEVNKFLKDFVKKPTKVDDLLLKKTEKMKYPKSKLITQMEKKKINVDKSNIKKLKGEDSSLNNKKVEVTKEQNKLKINKREELDQNLIHTQPSIIPTGETNNYQTTIINQNTDVISLIFGML